MQSKRKEVLLATGLIFFSFAFADFLPAGPWDDVSFTKGVFGLTGLCLLYLSWFEFTFAEFGVVPTIKKWKQPQTTWVRVAGIGFIILAFSWLSGNTPMREHLPEPSGIILMLIGLLVTYTGFYAFLITRGPLREEE